MLPNWLASNLTFRKLAVGTLTFIIVLSAALWFYYELRPLSAPGQAAAQIFEVRSGDGFREIVSRLSAEKLIRSSAAFEIFSLMTGSALDLKPGSYALSPAMSAPQIMGLLIKGSRWEVLVTIPEGSSLSDIDKILSDDGIISRFSLIKFSSSTPVEGRLFPDTYKLFTDSSAAEVVDKFLENFNVKALPILNRDPSHQKENLILASLIQKEVPDFEDAKIVAGILKKRLTANFPLQIDATICYIKKQLSTNLDQGCYPLSPLDFKPDSPYNTYLYKGLPPGPISNPGIISITAVMESKPSPFWFYLNDPITKKTIFSETLEEQNQNRDLYLKSANRSGKI